MDGATRSKSGSSGAHATYYNAAEDLLQRNLQAGRGGKIAYIDEAGSYSFAELAQRVDRSANALLASGLEPQERVLLVLLDTIDFPTCFLGAIKAGIVPIPLNTMLQAADYAHVLKDSGARVAVVSDSLVAKVRQGAGICDWRGQIIGSGRSGDEFPALAELMEYAGSTAATARTNSEDVCFWLYSSGSTGAPKAALHLQMSMVRTVELFAQGILGLREDDVIYSAAKLFFAYGLGNALSFPLGAGATSILYSGRATASAVCEVLRKHRPTVFCGVPTLFSALLACDELPERGEIPLRVCTSAGEALPAEVARAWETRMGVEVVDGIGSTEMLHIFISNRPGACSYGTTGKLVPGYRARIVNEGREVTDGEMGDLYVAGPTAAAGYWNNPERTGSTFLGDWVKTGDRFRQTADGNYVYCGRSDEMLKVGGIWVSPTEVESALMGHEAVLEAAVVGRADEHELIKPKAYVVLKPGKMGGSELGLELKEFVKGRLAPYKCPRWIEFVEELPKTATGKIRRNVLRENSHRERLRGTQRGSDDLAAERSEVVVDGKRLETVWYPPEAGTTAIVMLHEGLGSVALWKDFPERIARATKCGVLVYSRYGHGGSERLREKRPPEFMHHEAQAVLPELLETLGITQPILLGHSDGASIALIYAGHRPGAVRALVLEAPHVFVEDVTVASIAKIRDAYQETDLRAKLGRYHSHVDETFWGWNDIWLDARFREWNIESWVAAIKCPVLVIQGEQDEYGSFAQVTAISRRIPGTQTLLLRDCGHSPHRDQEEATLTTIAKFMENVIAKGRD